MSRIHQSMWTALVLSMFALPAAAQNFMVQCPSSTLLHPATPGGGGSPSYVNWPNSFAAGEPAYTGPLTFTTSSGLTYTSNGGAIKCQQVSGGDGYMTEADGNQTYMFAFGPLSGIDKIAMGQPGTDYPDEFNAPYCGGPTYGNGQPNPYWLPDSVDPITQVLTPAHCSDTTTYTAKSIAAVTGQRITGQVFATYHTDKNGAVGYLPPPVARTAYIEAYLPAIPTPGPTNSVSAVVVIDPGASYGANPTVFITPPKCLLSQAASSTCRQATAQAVQAGGGVQEIALVDVGAGYDAAVDYLTNAALQTYLPANMLGQPVGIAGAVRTDPSAIINTGVLNGNIPAPLMAFDEDDEFFLTLTNVGMIMRPDLFEQHTIHFHGYPNASSFYDGVPDASLAINIGASFTYYYLAPDAGTYFWHCHITPPEHLQMGMVGQLYVRPRQNRVPGGTDLYTSLSWQQQDLRTGCPNTGLPGVGKLAAGVLLTGVGGNVPSGDILCSTPMPAADNLVTQPAGGAKYAYNDGDGSTRYDVDVPIQIHGFDPNFHFVGMTFNSENFADMKDKYFLLNGRSYPDTIGVPAGSIPGWTGGVVAGATNPDPGTNAISTAASDTQTRPSQPMPTLITLSQNSTVPGGIPQRALLRIADLDVTEYQTLASLGIPMHVVGYNAKLLRDQAGNNMDYFANSITLGGGESLDVILDSALVPPGTYFLYTPQLDHLSNDAENFGGLMTEVVVTP